MSSRDNPSLYLRLFLVGALVVVLGLGVTALLLTMRLGAVRAEIEQGREEFAVLSSGRQAELARVEATLRAREREVAQLQDELKAALEKVIPKSGYIGEVVAGEFEEWIGRADELAKFLAMRRDLRIPEMEQLTATDWLDATKYDHFEDEEDLRKAAARLRRIAKVASAQKMTDALKGYMEASGGQFPKRAYDILEYADGSISEEVLERYEVQRMEAVKTVRFAGAKFVLVESKPVDNEWHTSMVFAGNSGYGYSGDGNLEPDAGE